ncbi:SUMF1/EgtB/PvdO family nonheme iron enzyme, partial [Oscillochloris sp. ZM17-4]|uniref:SUMF1/EgtB/PvdO family nonheme iron enzyme n=1 Tax=Oscillochloris sp. ZM17-4 TaxID=2866714 RepID=UPI001C735866
IGSACTAIVGDHADSRQPRASLTGILAALHDSPHLLYLVCHSRIHEGESLLYLEDDAGDTAVVHGSALVEAIESLSPPPLLAVLIACRSAGAGYGDGINALGPQLARAGLPAVLGFQGDVQQRTVRQCMRALWDELSNDGRIDRAMTVARRRIGDGMWWQPVLWLRARDGRLWHDSQPAQPAPSSTTDDPITLSPQLRALRADLWFESRKAHPDWAQVEQMALALLEALPSDEPTRRLLAEAGRWLALQTRYDTLRQRRDDGAGWGDITAAIADLERDWPGFPDPDGIRAWAAAQRRTARLQPAIAQLRERQSAHAALDLIERFLEEHPDDSDAAALVSSIIEMAEAPFEQRVRAAQMAGRIGDTRIPVDIAQWRDSLGARSYSFGRPDGYWCYVASGAYRVGGPEDGSGADLVLPAFWIARYPITAAQYGQFIADGGYHEERWWTPEGWGARQRGDILAQPWGWGEPRFSQPNQPVVGVGWDEATAFCAWLTQRLRPTLSSYQIRLPDEGVWEAAARYDDGRQPRSYPWGEEPPSIERAIHATQPARLRDAAPAPVGCCVAGAAACGALDMAGNTWELMASSWESYPHGAAAPGPDEHLAWRGGTWASSARAMRCTERDRTRRDGHNYAQGGFRVIIAPR